MWLTILIITVFLIGVLSGHIFGISGWTSLYAGCEMQTSILRELLETPAHKRSDRLLDLCFFQLSNKRLPIDISHFLTDEVIDHLDARINDPAPIPNPRNITIIKAHGPHRFKLDYSTPSIYHPMGYEEEVVTVVQRIKDHRRKRENQHMEVVTQSGNTSNYDDGLLARKAA
jgi:hypothetical protein